MSGKLVILSGPSGVGKDTLLDRLQLDPGIQRVCAFTTREPRSGEIDGVDYHFVDRETFDRMALAGEFVEFKIVHGNGYATPVAGLQRILDEGKFAVLKIDTQGALDVMDRRPDALTIFILPPSIQELERRIRTRATDSEEKIQIRMQNARDELAVADRYQYKIVNEDLESALAEIQKILTDA